MKNHSTLDKRPLVDYLLLEYLWRKGKYILGVYVSRDVITGDNFIYHRLDLAELTNRLYSLIQDGMFLLDSNEGHIGFDKVYLTKSKLKEHLSRCSESEEYRLGNDRIYIRLSFKGGKTWEQKVKANWNQYYYLLASSERVWMESGNKEFLTKVLKFELANSILIPDGEIELNVFKPWYPPFVYWKQFARGYSYRFAIKERNFDFSRDLRKLYSINKLKHWRWVWLYDKRTGLMLRPPEELYG
ncbi:MAG: hypothetical protein BWK78_04950 [Thiotrichaceae bacterium IS1]|nr:MAG: hypothetical protein BWK78_04950 [Thiotrichaceae bacterium IS1]